MQGGGLLGTPKLLHWARKVLILLPGPQTEDSRERLPLMGPWVLQPSCVPLERTHPSR